MTLAYHTAMKKLIPYALTAIVISLSSFNVHAVNASELIYHDASTLPVIGTLAQEATKAYSRLPDSLQGKVRKELFDLGKDPAGMAVRFRSDASAIGAQWTSLLKFNMNHMTATGVRGLDLYVLNDNGQWTTVGSARPTFNDHHTRTLIISDMEPKMREYMLYLSLYDGVDSLSIGVDSTAVVLPPQADSPKSDKVVIMYGTSILQGGCASRPGMAHSSILERMLDREVINLGFSGNGRLDPEIAQLIASCPNPGLIVIDCLPNCKKEQIEERLENFYNIIRKSHPAVPILFVESPIFPLMRLNTETLATITAKNDTFRTIYERIAGQDPNVYYFYGKDVLGDTVEGTVDNFHFTDLGFTHYANALYPVLKSLLEDKSKP